MYYRFDASIAHLHFFLHIGYFTEVIQAGSRLCQGHSTVNQRVICRSETSETRTDMRDQSESLRARAPRQESCDSGKIIFEKFWTNRYSAISLHKTISKNLESLHFLLYHLSKKLCNLILPKMYPLYYSKYCYYTFRLSLQHYKRHSKYYNLPKIYPKFTQNFCKISA